MNTRTRLQYVLAFAGLSFCALAMAQDQAPAEPATGQPHLELSTLEWNMGEVWQGGDVSKEVTLQNTGNAMLEISVRTSCGCTAVTKPKSPLPPGESTSLTIAYHTAGRMGAVNQTVTITTNDPTQRSVALKLAGNVKMTYELEPKDGNSFGDLWQSSQGTSKVVIVNKYTDKLHLKVKEGQDFGPLAVELKELEPGMRYELSATLKPPLNVGRLQVLVALTTDIAQMPEIKVPISGQVQPPVAVRPARLLLSKNAAGETQQVLNVVHAPDQPIEVTGVKSTDDAVKVELQPAAQAAGAANTAGEYRIVVTLPPGERLAEGAAPKIEITTTSQDPEYQKVIVPIQIVAGSPAAHTPTAAAPAQPAAGPKSPKPTPAVRPAPARRPTPE